MEHQKAMKKVITPTMMIIIMMFTMRKKEATKQIKNKRKEIVTTLISKI